MKTWKSNIETVEVVANDMPRMNKKNSKLPNNNPDFNKGRNYKPNREAEINMGSNFGRPGATGVSVPDITIGKN